MYFFSFENKKSKWDVCKRYSFFKVIFCFIFKISLYDLMYCIRDRKKNSTSCMPKQQIETQFFFSGSHVGMWLVHHSQHHLLIHFNNCLFNLFTVLLKIHLISCVSQQLLIYYNFILFYSASSGVLQTNFIVFLSMTLKTMLLHTDIDSNPQGYPVIDMHPSKLAQ